MGLLLAIAALTADPYATAREQAMLTGRPLLILIGAEWCGPCQDTKAQCLKFKRFATIFAYVDYDGENRRARSMLAGNSIPQLTAWRYAEGRWRKSQALIGRQDVPAISRILTSVGGP